jgi:G3E family GTPase
MRLKGILNCQSHDQAVVIQGVYQWLEVRQGAGEPPAESALVLIGRYLDKEELSREWADCLAHGQNMHNSSAPIAVDLGSPTGGS